MPSFAWPHASLSAFAGLVAVTFAAALAIPACGGSSQNGTPPPEAGADTGGGMTDAPMATDASDAGAEAASTSDGGHYPMPQVVNVANGPVLKTPKVYLVFYPGYSYETQLEAMAQALGASTLLERRSRRTTASARCSRGHDRADGRDAADERGRLRHPDLPRRASSRAAPSGRPTRAPSTRSSTRPRRPSPCPRAASAAGTPRAARRSAATTRTSPSR